MFPQGIDTRYDYGHLSWDGCGYVQGTCLGDGCGEGNYGFLNKTHYNGNGYSNYPYMLIQYWSL